VTGSAGGGCMLCNQVRSRNMPKLLEYKSLADEVHTDS
jgi:hypothetical protein